MDLLILARKLWRFRRLTLPIIALTLAGAVYAVALKSPQYEATASYLLINPPPPPTADQIREHPELANVRTDNPYTRFGDQSVIVEVLSRSLGSASARDALAAKGADRHYTVESAVRWGTSTPIVQVVGTGATPAAAARSAKVVSDAVTGELNRMQAVQHVDARYRITTLQVQAPNDPQLQPTGQIRMLLAILAAGTIMLFIAVSFADALQSLAAERRVARRQEPWTPDDLAVVDGGADGGGEAAAGADEPPTAAEPAVPRGSRRLRL
jgi:hypothetical protein